MLPSSHPMNRLHLGVNVEHLFLCLNLTIYSNKTFRQKLWITGCLNLTITLKRIKSSSMFYHAGIHGPEPVGPEPDQKNIEI